MKSIFYAVFILAIANGVHSKCSEEGENVIKQCYTNFLKEVPLTVSPDSLALGNLTSLTKEDDEKMEKAFAEKQKCIEGYESDCLNIETFTHAFGATLNDTIVFLFLDFTFDYLIKAEPEVSKEDAKCFSTFKIDGKCPLPKGCLGLNKYVDCAKDLLIKKCDNQKAAQVFRDALMDAFKKVFPTCE
uniref:Uncharacterized protein n=1 Tax=Panagrolaimus sp. PS1159 TaxID=55785 RepID=A0AC35GP35_9BILA